MNYYGQVITWDELRNLILRAAGGLKKLGIKKGDRVYLGMANSPQFVICYYAAHSLGAVIMAMSPLYKAGEVSYAVNDAGVKVMIIEESVVPVYNQIKDMVPTVEHVVVTALDEYLPEDPYPAFPADLKASGPVSRYSGLESFMAADPITQFEDVRSDDLALLNTPQEPRTSQRAMLTHKNRSMGPGLTLISVPIRLMSALLWSCPCFTLLP